MRKRKTTTKITTMISAMTKAAKMKMQKKMRWKGKVQMPMTNSSTCVINLPTLFLPKLSLIVTNKNCQLSPLLFSVEGVVIYLFYICIKIYKENGVRRAQVCS